MSSQQECCICFDELNAKINNCVTQCGHVFCFQCIAKSLSQSNTCPCCRAILAEKPEEEEESVWSEDDSENEDPLEQFTDYALQSNRWMFQREEGEEIDPEEAEAESENDSIEENEETWTEVEEDDEPVAEVEEIVSKLQQRGITMVDIIAMFLERKSKNVRKHNPGFFAALDVMIDDITYECDMDVKERASSNNVQTETV
jgi:hypothetical protein